jgi:uncharacterized RDD family membrane protein YckC
LSSVAPGWHKDPSDPTTQRYWDGEGWLGDPLPIDAIPPAAAPGMPTTPPPNAPPPKVSSRDAAPRNGVPADLSPPNAALAPPNAALAPPISAPPGTPPNAPPPGAWGPVAGPPPGQVPPGPWGPGSPPAGYRLVPVPVVAPPAPRPHGYPVANPALRLAARAIDTVVLLGLNALVNGYFIYLWWQSFLPYYREITRSGASQPSEAQVPPQYETLLLAITIIGIALWFAYEVPAVANTGQTLGKRLVGIKVLRVDADEPVGFRRSIRRWNPMGLPTFLWTCGVGFVLQAIDAVFVLFDRPLHRALHDKTAGTVVVHVGRDRIRKVASDKEGEPR